MWDRYQLSSTECLFLPEFGGVLYATEESRLPFEFQHFERQLKLSLDTFSSIKMAIGINHDECKMYTWAHAEWGSRFVFPNSSIKQRQEGDLKLYAAMVRRVAPRVKVGRFHMDFTDESRASASFREVLD